MTPEEMATEMLRADAESRGLYLKDMGILTQQRVNKLKQREVALSLFDGQDSLTDIRARDRELAISRGRKR